MTGVRRVLFRSRRKNTQRIRPFASTHNEHAYLHCIVKHGALVSTGGRGVATLVYPHFEQVLVETVTQRPDADLLYTKSFMIAIINISAVQETGT